MRLPSRRFHHDGFVVGQLQCAKAEPFYGNVVGLGASMAGLTSAILIAGALQSSVGSAQTIEHAAHPARSETASEESSPPSARFISPGFDPPTLVETAAFTLAPLGPQWVEVDFDAYMSSIDHLQKSFTRSTDWPHAGISRADAMQDMENEQARFRRRESFAYAVLTPDGQRERGSVYIRPSLVPGYDAMVSMCVTKAEYDAGFDRELYTWVTGWVRNKWPFVNVAYPGRAIPWARWDAMVAARPAAGE